MGGGSTGAEALAASAAVPAAAAKRARAASPSSLLFQRAAKYRTPSYERFRTAASAGASGCRSSPSSATSNRRSRSLERKMPSVRWQRAAVAKRATPLPGEGSSAALTASSSMPCSVSA